jgi:8-oxo-dGTP pyrophosphatase MutT (NUDIX family)
MPWPFDSVADPRAPGWVREALARVTPQTMDRPGLTRAAVVLTLCDAGPGADIDGLEPPPDGGWSPAPALLLTRRAARLNRHAGQWALPGGRLDPGETAEQAGLRELDEELGLPLAPERLLGRLDDYATRSGYVITPLVAWAGAVQGLRPAPAEVASVHRLPLQELLRDDAPWVNQPRSGGAPILRMPVGHRWIAAPTAAFLLQFREWVLLGRPTRVAHYDQPFFARR